MTSRSAAVIALVLLAFLSPGGAAGSQGAPATECATVYVINHGWHTGIAVPSPDFGPEAFFRKSPFGDWRWLEFGWGDAAFYQTPDAGLGLALRALLTPTDTVMHVVGWNNTPPESYPARETLAIKLPPAGYRAVIDFIKGGFVRDAEGRPVPSEDGWYGRSAFFKARGTYSILRTCNTWLAEALVKAGLPLVTENAARAEDLMAQLRALRWNGCRPSRKAAEVQETE